MMNAFTRRQFGALIIGCCLLNGIVLALFGVKLCTVKESHVIQTGMTSNYSASFSANATWPMMILMAITLIGFLLLIVPGRKKIPPEIQPQP
jgi:hypothetical protein